MMRNLSRVLRKNVVPLLLSVLLVALWTDTVTSQTTGRIQGRVMSAETGKAIPGVNVVVRGTTMGAATDFEGRYTISGVPPGTYTLMISAVGYRMVEKSDVRVSAGQTAALDAELEEETIQMGDVLVTAASLRPERITDAPAAVTVMSAREIQMESNHGQIPRMLESQPGVDIVQSGVSDFNINTRGFNSSLNRRLLVLLDGRDMAIPLLSVQEWTSVPIPPEDMKRLELVRGPGSALYGANAFNGVVNVVSASPREVLGTRVTVGGGELSTLRADVRHAGASGPWSYKVNLGRLQSDTWSKDRTVAPFEYAGLTPERRKLNTDDIVTNYGSARLDRDFADGSVLTFEGGWVQVENELFVTGIGRVQVGKTNKPWGRINYGTQRINAQVWATTRNSSEPNYSLLSGIPIEDKSYNVHAEFQHNFSALENRFRLVWGASQRFQHTDTEGTLLRDIKGNTYVADDNFTGVYGQAEYQFADQLKGLVATRIDRSSLFDTQISPKAAIVWSPNTNHTFRATFNRAFQYANYSEYFLYVDVSAPVNLQPLELGIEAALSAAVGSPVDLPLNFGPTRVLALGNEDLDVEKILGWEVGYKGVYGRKLFVTLDAYYNRLEDFITDLLPGVNPDFPSYKVPAAVPAAFLPTVEGAIRSNLGANFPLFATLPNGSPAFVVSYSNAGKVNEYGGELGINYYISDELLLGANYAYFRFEVKDKKVGDVLLPNAPRHKGNVGLSYLGKKLNGSVRLKLVDGFPWAAGVFAGNITGYAIVNVAAGYQIHKNVHLGLTVTNALDKEHYEIFGGSLNGRRAIGSLAVTF